MVIFYIVRVIYSVFDGKGIEREGEKGKGREGVREEGRGGERSSYVLF